jgi:hemerythrin
MDNPNIPALDIMKEVGRIWQNITKEELDYFKEKAKKDMERHKREHERFIEEINELRAKNKPDKHDTK